MKEEPRFDVSKRWIACIDELISTSEIPNYKAFCQVIGIKPQSLNDIKTARRAVTLDIVVDTCQAYRVSLTYLLLGTGERLLSTQAGGEVAYQLPAERIPTAVSEHGPGDQLAIARPATHRTFPLISPDVAGAYATRYQQAAYYRSLATIELPPRLAPGAQAGILFQLADESMAPAFEPQEWVAGTLLSPPEWARLPEQEYLLVASHKQGLQLRRVHNLLATQGVLRCEPVNAAFPVEELPAADVLQMFRVLFRLLPGAGSAAAALQASVARLEEATATLSQQLQQVQTRLDALTGPASS